MNDADRRRIAEALQRENDSVARAAASEANARFTSPLGHGSLRSQLPDLLREGFAHLGGALSLSVLVDEPGLLADDLDWLVRMLLARGMNLDPPMIDLLLQSYLDACSTILEAEEIEALRDLIDRAKGCITWIGARV